MKDADQAGCLNDGLRPGKAKSVQQTTYLTRATSTGPVHRAVVKVGPSLTIGNPATHTTEAREEFKA